MVYKVPFSFVNNYHSLFLFIIIAMPVSYNNDIKHRYVVFRNSDSPRNINISCDIIPGSLKQQYGVKWVNISTSNEVTTDLPEEYDIELPIAAMGDVEYRCIVDIQHRSDRNTTEPYYGKRISITQKGCCSLCHKVLVMVLLYPLHAGM